VLRILDACQKSLNARDQVVPIQQVIPSQLEKEYFIHETSLVESPSHIGKGTKIWHFSHIMPGASIGENCNLGQNVFVAKDVMIGNNVKIQNNVSVFEGVTLESDVFCGPSCIFTNVTRPRSEISQKGKYIKTLVKQGATIGANATIVCGHFIGKYALIGAGSVITEDIPDYALAYGNPAKIHGWACRCGSELTFGSDNLAQCSECGRKYQKWGQNRIEFSGGKDK
jgi:UDP-2-acetamido-3-amino-2,3-dideoxy-glucuronate N-acetyltransferase